MLPLYNYIGICLRQLYHKYNLPSSYRVDMQHDLFLEMMTTSPMKGFVKRYIYVVCYRAVISALRRMYALQPFATLIVEDPEKMSTPTPQYEFFSTQHAEWMKGLRPPSPHDNNQKKITIELEDGTEIEYESMGQAAKDLMVQTSTIHYWLHKGLPKQGKYNVITKISMSSPAVPTLIFSSSPLKQRKKILRATWEGNPTYEMEYVYDTDKGSDYNEWYTLYAHKTLPGEGLIVKERYDTKRKEPEK